MSWAQVTRQLASRLGSEAAEAPFPQYVNDPAGFARDVLGWSPWGAQEEIGEALVEDQRVTVVSCNGAGKTAWASRLLLWFVCTRVDAVVVTTAPTWSQVGLLWREVRSAYRTAQRQLPGELMQTRLDLTPTWYAQGLSSDSEEKYQGYHARGSEPGGPGGLLVIVDEASGVADGVFDSISGYLTSRNAYVLLIGNGNKPEGAFYQTHQKGPWRRFQIAATDVPSSIISREWVEEMRLHWGEGSPQYQVRVLGQFPSGGSDWQLFPTWLLEAAADRDLEPAGEGEDQEQGCHIGVDVARSGSDRTVAVVTDGGAVIDVRAWQGADLMETAQKIRQLAASHSTPGPQIHVDVAGIGAGVVDRLREMSLPVDGVDFGGRVQHDYDWLLGRDFHASNRKAELHWAGRHALQHGHARISRDHTETLWRQLGWLNYEMTEKGAFQVEKKERVRARFGESPDYADAWIISLSRSSLVGRRIFLV